MSLDKIFLAIIGLTAAGYILKLACSRVKTPPGCCSSCDCGGACSSCKNDKQNSKTT